MVRKNISLLILLLASFVASQSQSFDPSLFNDLKWRMIGPYRGGRTVGAVGVPTQPNVFYIGVNNGGIWKTTDYGRTWYPIFDDQPTGSVGDVAVSPSNPNVLYAGSGEGLQRPDLSVGDGIYKSLDAGKTWSHLGLDSVQQIGGLAIDPTNENKVFVAALGHPYGANAERGIYRTTDGGKTWQKVLYRDENTGAIQVTIDPKNPDVVYADMWAGRQAPWENGEWNGAASGLYKSIDGGNTWKQLTKGLPSTAEGLTRIGFGIAPSDPQRLYATVDCGNHGGIYRSDDAGASWTIMTSDERFWGRGDDFAEIKVDPANADIVYSADVVVWKSVDGAKTWKAFRGAPGGDDYHRLWINPVNGNIILIASDQGAIITVNGGETFSSWYNQPTGQMYHVSADNAFPYNVYSGQQESGSVGIASRSNDGQITFHDWHPVGAEEYGYVTADPLNPDIIYGGKLSKYNKRTGQTQEIAPEVTRSGKYRFLRTAPLLFSPIDHKTLYYAGNVLFSTNNGGLGWKIISPDLSRDSWDVPASIGIYSSEALKKMPRRGVIYAVAPSPIDIKTIWCGTDDGLVHITRDGGKTWHNVTPPKVTSWCKISIMDASHFDVNTAYAAVNCIRLDDMNPHIYKTNDAGKTWHEVVNGLPADPINVVREDPLRKGLLFAGSERAVYVSFDDGAHWQSLRLNMPATSIRDLIIKDDDLVIGTHGRSFWILDDITPLRQVADEVINSAVFLYKPSNPYRVRWSMWTDTPLPPEEPAGQNPPDGAVIDYYLKDSCKEVILQILDSNNKLVRSFSSHDTIYAIPDLNIPLYWIRPQQILAAGPGNHRFIWDLHYTPLNVPPSYPIGAVYSETAPAPTSPWVMPGIYTVKLFADRKASVQKITVKIDPRVKTPVKDLQLQHDLSVICYKAEMQITNTLDTMNNMRQVIKAMSSKATGKELMKLQDADTKVAALEQANPASALNFTSLKNSFGALLGVLEGSDMTPTNQVVNSVRETNLKLAQTYSSWKKIKQEIAGLAFTK
jgi:photosystem II stability/assembly factor-like uncharacterized protein